MREKEEDTTDFRMPFPEFGIEISVEQDSESASGNGSWKGMSLPPFGFNVTVDKEPTQCLVGTRIYNDFEEVPNEDPCQRCKCSAGQVQCFNLACPTPPPGCKRSRRPRQKQTTCCPVYQCAENQGPSSMYNLVHAHHTMLRGYFGLKYHCAG